MSNSPITITDTATPYLEFIAKTKPDWTRKAMKSVGWMMQKEIKAGIKIRLTWWPQNMLTSCHLR